MNEFVNMLFSKTWELFNLGIDIDGFYLKFWYIPAFYMLIRMILNLFGFSSGSGARERTGKSANYKKKGAANDD